MLTYFAFMNFPLPALRFCFPVSKTPVKLPVKLLKRIRIDPLAVIRSLSIKKPSMRSVEAMTAQRSSAGIHRLLPFVLRNRIKLAAADAITIIPAEAITILSFRSLILPIIAAETSINSAAVISQASSAPPILFVLYFSMLLFIENPRPIRCSTSYWPGVSFIPRSAILYLRLVAAASSASIFAVVEIAHFFT